MSEYDKPYSLRLIQFINDPETSAADISQAFDAPDLGERISAERKRLTDTRGSGFSNLSEIDKSEILGNTRLGVLLDKVRAGALDHREKSETVVKGGSSIPAFIVSTPIALTPVEFLPWYALAHPCRIAPVTRTEVYSRGNNDQGEMTTQLNKTGKTQYNTGTFELEFLADPVACLCVQNKCTGVIGLTLSMKIILAGGAAPLGYMMVPGPIPSAPTTPVAGGGVPGPDVNVTIDRIDVPAAAPGNTFVQPAAAKAEFTANATQYLPCTPGTYARRFHIFPNGLAGVKGVVPGIGPAGLVFFIDVNATVTSTGGCSATIALETFMMEFRLGYDFSHGGALPTAPAELPEVRPTLPAGVAPGVNVNTHNIAKRISTNGTASDAAFPPRAP